jgi:hypothetical protein
MSVIGKETTSTKVLFTQRGAKNRFVPRPIAPQIVCDDDLPIGPLDRIGVGNASSLIDEEFVTPGASFISGKPGSESGSTKASAFRGRCIVMHQQKRA